MVLFVGTSAPCNKRNDSWSCLVELRSQVSDIKWQPRSKFFFLFFHFGLVNEGLKYFLFPLHVPLLSLDDGSSSIFVVLLSRFVFCLLKRSSGDII